MIRASGTSTGDHTLTLLDKNQPKHYKISSRDGKWELAHNDQTFDDLDGLVEYYIAASKGRAAPLDKALIERVDAALPSKEVMHAKAGEWFNRAAALGQVRESGILFLRCDLGTLEFRHAA